MSAAGPATSPAVGLGTILHWQLFQFRSGSQANKYLVIVGAHRAKNYVAVVTTSQSKSFQLAISGGGCNSNNPSGRYGGYYYIEKNSGNFFWMDTWLPFEDTYELDPIQVSSNIKNRTVQIVGQVTPETVREICNCMLVSKEVSLQQKELLGP